MVETVRNGSDLGLGLEVGLVVVEVLLLQLVIKHVGHGQDLTPLAEELVRVHIRWIVQHRVLIILNIELIFISLSIRLRRCISHLNYFVYIKIIIIKNKLKTLLILRLKLFKVILNR